MCNTAYHSCSGVVYTCGLNDAHQLGLGSAPNSTPKQCLTPTPITVSSLSLSLSLSFLSSLILKIHQTLVHLVYIHTLLLYVHLLLIMTFACLYLLLMISVCLSVQAKNLRGRQIRGIGVGRYHTALATESHVYTFGQNLGQLGYERNYHTQIIPKAVSTFSFLSLTFTNFDCHMWKFVTGKM